MHGPAEQREWDNVNLGTGQAKISTTLCALRNDTSSVSSSPDDPVKLFQCSLNNRGCIVEGHVLTVTGSSDFQCVFEEWKASLKGLRGKIVVVRIQIVQSNSVEEGLAYAYVHQ